MRVLLTGASGFLGRHVLHNLRTSGIDTIAMGRQCPQGCTAVDWIEADLLTCATVDDLVQASGATHLLHLAWFTEHGAYWDSPLNLQWVEASTRLVQAFCQGGGQKVVVAGTCAEYDWQYGTCHEDVTPLQPDRLYGTAKDATRRLVQAICAQYQVPCAWGRVFLPFGTGEDRRRLVPSLTDVFRGKRLPFGIHVNACRDFLHASDVASGFVTLLAKTSSGPYNISSGQAVRLADVATELARLLNASVAPVLDLAATLPGAPPLLVGDNRKLKALGWQPRLTLAQGLKLSIEDQQGALPC
jgi:nucleoside-diphosphate-sugar epimerase